MDGKLGENEYAPRLVGNVIYVHYTHLKHWEENKEARVLHEKDWRRLLTSLEQNGVKDTMEIGDDGTIYDGNHRWDGVKYLIEEKGITMSTNGKDLAWLPVRVSTPQNDIEMLSLALKGNDGSFAIYNQEWIEANQERIEQIPGWEDISVDTEEPLTLGEAFELVDDEEQGDEGDDEEESDAQETSGSSNDTSEPKATNLGIKEITCPNCSHTFPFKA